MNRKETVQMMAVLRAAYPRYYRDMSREELLAVVNLWADMFAADPANIVGAAVKALIATDEKGFPPHVGAVKAKIQQITAPREMTEQEAWGYVSKALRNSLYNSEKEFDALPPEVQDIVHAPEQLKQWAMMPLHEVETVVASNVQRSYRARAVQNRQFAMMPPDVRSMISTATANIQSLPEGEF